MEQTIYLEEKQTERAPTPNPLFSVHADFMANLSFKIAEKVALQDFVQQQGKSSSRLRGCREMKSQFVESMNSL